MRTAVCVGWAGIGGATIVNYCEVCQCSDNGRRSPGVSIPISYSGCVVVKISVWKFCSYWAFHHTRKLWDTSFKMFTNFVIVWPCIVIDSLWIKLTDELNFNFIGITTLNVSGSLSTHYQEFLTVHRLWYILCSCDRLLSGVGWNVTYSLWIKPTDAPNSNFIGITTLRVPGSLSAHHQE